MVMPRKLWLRLPGLSNLTLVKVRRKVVVTVKTNINFMFVMGWDSNCCLLNELDTQHHRDLLTLSPHCIKGTLFSVMAE